MSRSEPMNLVPLAKNSTPSSLANAWECPRCHRVVREAGAMPRCPRCGFWDTAS